MAKKDLPMGYKQRAIAKLKGSKTSYFLSVKKGQYAISNNKSFNVHYPVIDKHGVRYGHPHQIPNYAKRKFENIMMGIGNYKTHIIPRPNQR